MGGPRDLRGNLREFQNLMAFGFGVSGFGGLGVGFIV